MNKLIRNIPDNVARVLQEQAKAKGLTLEAYILLILIETAKKPSERVKRPGGQNGKEG